jgi:methyl-accepting chemotaxis protein
MGGCCCSGSYTKETRDLGERIKYLTDKNQELENKIKENSSQITEPDTSLDQAQKSIDKDLSSSAQVTKFLLSVSGSDSTQPTKRPNDAKLSTTQNFIKYAEEKAEESEYQSKLCTKFEESYKALIKLVDIKYHEVEKKVHAAKAELKDNSNVTEELEELINESISIQRSEGPDVDHLVTKLEYLFKADKKISSLEILKAESDHNIDLGPKAKDISNYILDLIIVSKRNIKDLQEKFGTDEEIPSSVSEIDLGSLPGFLETLETSLKDLYEIENITAKIIQNTKLLDTLDWLDKELTAFFIKSENAKSLAFSKLIRLGGASKNIPILSDIFDREDLKSNSPTAAAEVLKERTIKFLSISEDHEKIFFKMIEGFSLFEEKIDSFELKLDEVISGDLKDLQKIMILTDTESKNKFETIKQELLKSQEEISRDITEHIDFLYKKLETATGIELIRKKIRDSQVKEINKIKQDLQDKINELNIKITSIQSEKAALENSNSTLKATSEKTSKLIEKLTKTVKEKEDETSTFKNTISRLTEQCEQLSEEIASNQREIEGLTKENKDYRKNLRQKEKEITELNEKLSNS